MMRLGAFLAISVGLVSLNGCSSDDTPAPPGAGGSGGSGVDSGKDTGTGGGAKDAAAEACGAPFVGTCGQTPAMFGTHGAGCMGAQVCCLAPGCAAGGSSNNLYTGLGAKTTCETPSTTPSGMSAYCSGTSIQLCGIDAECPTGYHCDPAGVYCVLGASEGGTSEAGTEGGTDGATSEAGDAAAEGSTSEAGTDAAAE